MTELDKSKKIDNSKNMVYINVNKLMLVNKQNCLGSNFIPPGLVVPRVKFQSGSTSKQMVKEAAIALENLFNEAKTANIILMGVSGYRSYDRQATIYNNKVNAVGAIEANKYVAKPGQSEHQTGLAMDVLCNKYWKLDDGFAGTSAYKWLTQNAANYGFIIRYPKGKSHITGYNYEPWHLRYVGTEYAKSIKEAGLCLEEYLQREI